jgi:hypothetical protein
MNEARNVLRRCGFRFEASWARVLGGNDEGIYAWVALNAAEGRLGTGNTLGALDLGGSSLQVTFAMDGDGSGNEIGEEDLKGGKGAAAAAALHAAVHAPFAVNVSLLGTHHTLYTHSHHHFGLDDAFERSVSILLEEKNNINGGSGSGSGKKNRELLLLDGVQLEHPCLHKGYNQKYDRIPLEGRVPSPTSVKLLGKPDASACSRLAEKVVSSPTECDAPPCALGTPQPRAAGKFIALAGFYVVSHFFNLGANAGVAAVAKAGTNFCPLTWAEIQSRHPGEMAVETYCFRTAYIAALVPQGLGLKEDQVEIGQGTAGWTLGAALMEGHRHAGLGGKAIVDGGAAAAGGGDYKLGGSKMSSTAVSDWAGNLLPSWGGQAAAGVLAVLILAAVVLAYRRANDAVVRSFRGQGWIEPRRRSSSGILSAAEFGSQDLGNNNSNTSSGGSGSGFLSGVFFRFFRGGATKATNGKRASPSSLWHQHQPGMSNSSENGTTTTTTAASASFYDSPGSLSAVGSARALGLTRSATYSRRLSALESASSERI